LESVGSTPNSDATFLRGAFRNTVTAPGVAPWVGGRVGLGSNNEASLIYTGRSLRVGARHAWLWGPYALSAGGGAASVLTRQNKSNTPGSDDGLDPRGVDWPAAGFSLDLPLSFGWSSSAELLSAWFGARAAFTSLYGDFPFITGGQRVAAEADAQHLQLGGFAGLSVGVDPFWVRVELAAHWNQIWAQAELPWADAQTDTVRDSFDAFLLFPAAALVLQF
jgi:hypothetical protein